MCSSSSTTRTRGCRPAIASGTLRMPFNCMGASVGATPPRFLSGSWELPQSRSGTVERPSARSLPVSGERLRSGDVDGLVGLGQAQLEMEANGCQTAEGLANLGGRLRRQLHV